MKVPDWLFSPKTIPVMPEPGGGGRGTTGPASNIWQISSTNFNLGRADYPHLLLLVPQVFSPSYSKVEKKSILCMVILSYDSLKECQSTTFFWAPITTLTNHKIIDQQSCCLIGWKSNRWRTGILADCHTKWSNKNKMFSKCLKRSHKPFIHFRMKGTEFRIH